MDLTKQANAVAFMKKSKSRDDWTYKTQIVIKANNGLPTFWYGAMIASGLRARLEKEWG